MKLQPPPARAAQASANANKQQAFRSTAGPAAVTSSSNALAIGPGRAPAGLAVEQAVAGAEKERQRVREDILAKLARLSTAGHRLKWIVPDDGRGSLRAKLVDYEVELTPEGLLILDKAGRSLGTARNPKRLAELAKATVGNSSSPETASLARLRGMLDVLLDVYAADLRQEGLE